MKKAAKGWLIAATVLTVAGLAAIFGAFAAAGFDYSKLATIQYVTNTEEVSADFDNISFTSPLGDLELVYSEEKNCRLVFHEQEKLRFSAEVNGKTLSIRTTDTREWYDYFGFSFESPKATLYLPKKEYNALMVQAVTGDVTVPKELRFRSVSVDSVTSCLHCEADVAGSVDVNVTTGNILLANTAPESVRLTTTTGCVTLSDVTAKSSVSVETTTGVVSLQNTVAAGSMSIACTTGNIAFDRCDAAQITAATTTGNVTGTLLSGKDFITKVMTGEISVPKASSGGMCSVTTTTGNIQIDVVE